MYPCRCQHSDPDQENLLDACRARSNIGSISARPLCRWRRNGNKARRTPMQVSSTSASNHVFEPAKSYSHDTACWPECLLMKRQRCTVHWRVVGRQVRNMIFPLRVELATNQTEKWCPCCCAPRRMLLLLLLLTPFASRSTAAHFSTRMAQPLGSQASIGKRLCIRLQQMKEVTCIKHLTATSPVNQLNLNHNTSQMI